MLLYFEFEERRVNAEVEWPEDEGTITVHITDAELAKELPTDLLFEISNGNKISYTIESPGDERLIELQRVIGRRLEELAG